MSAISEKVFAGRRRRPAGEWKTGPEVNMTNGKTVYGRTLLKHGVCVTDRWFQIVEESGTGGRF